MKKHMIVPDGYNIGRNWFVEKATAGSYLKGKWWKAEVEWREGLLEPGRHGACIPQSLVPPDNPTPLFSRHKPRHSARRYRCHPHDL